MAVLYACIVYKLLHTFVKRQLVVGDVFVDVLGEVDGTVGAEVGHLEPQTRGKLEHY